jgi:hypothetical protein
MTRRLLNFLDDCWAAVWDRFCWIFIGLGILFIAFGILVSDLFFKKNSTP